MLENGNLLADEEMWRDLQSVARRVCARCRVPSQDVADLVQTVMMQAWRQWAIIREPKAWLQATTRLTCLSYWRQKKSWKALEDLSEEEHPRAPESKPLASADLSRAAARLRTQDRELLRLIFVAGYTTRELVGATRSAVAVKAARHRATRRLRQELTGRARLKP
jgi:RNA polymerase sigma factor (sigma-70 family)